MRTEEVELLLQIVADASLGATFHERFNGIMEAFSTLVPSSSMTAFVLDVSKEKEPTPQHAIFRNGEVAQLQEYAANYMHSDPMLPGLAAMDGVPTTLSDFVAPGAFSRDPYTGEFLPRFGVRHIMGISHRIPGGALLSIGIQRDKGLRDFSARERKLVELVSPYLSRAAYGAVLREQVTEQASKVSGSAQDHRSGVAVFDSQGSMIHADAGALSLLSLLAGAGSLSLDTLVVEARGLCRAEVTEGQTLERTFLLPDRGAVRVRLAQVNAASLSVLVTLELMESGTKEHFDVIAARFGLTPRERDITAFAIRGLGNREIGFKLGISAVTVGVLLSKIYSKVRVQGRNELTSLFLGGSMRDDTATPRVATP